MRTVTIETRTVGQFFATCAIIRDASSRRRLAETGVRPYGFTGAAIADALSLAAARGWQVAS